jgi:cob(I)alamin adenosyltransferase
MDKTERFVSKMVKGDGRSRSRARLSENIADSKARIQCSSALEELFSHIGFARCICPDEELRKLLKRLQMDLYGLGAAVAGPSSANKASSNLLAPMDLLDSEIQRIKSVPGILGNEVFFCEHPAAAALDVARATGRRAERFAKSLVNKSAAATPLIPVYLNRLTDLLWLLSRLLESRYGTSP